MDQAKQILLEKNQVNHITLSMLIKFDCLYLYMYCILFL